MASLVPIYNGQDPGTGLQPANTSKRKLRQTLVERIKEQSGENTARWNAATISMNFRAGSYDGTSYTSTPSLVRGKTEFVCNIIDRPCLWVSGYQRQNRKDFELTAINQNYSHVCDQRNKVLKYFSTKNHFAEQFSEACDAALTEGFVLLEPYIQPTPLFACNPMLKVWHACDFITDSYFRQADLSDCSYIATSQFLPSEEAECTFPWADSSIFYNASDANADIFYFQPKAKAFPKSSDVCHVVRLWNRTAMTRHYMVNMSTGEMTSIEKPFTDKEIKFISRKINSPVKQKTVKEVGWALTVIVNNHIIMDSVPNPLGFSECPMVPLFWRHNPTALNVALRFPSLPGQLQDAQYLSDRRICMTHDILEARAQAGWMVPKGSMDDTDILHAQQNASIIHFNAEVGAPIPIQPTVVPPTTLEMIEQLRRFADEASPIGKNLMGVNPQEGQSGVKTMLEQGAGLVGLRPIFDAWDRALRLTGNLVDKIIVNNLSPEEAQMILGQEPLDPKFFNMHEGAASMAVTEGLHTDTQKKTQLNQWMEFCQLTGTQLPPEAWALITPMQRSDEIMQILQQQQKAAAEQAQLAQEYEVAMSRAKVAQTNADALDKVAMARERDARAQSNIGLQDERESEVNKNNAIYVNNIVDSLVKLMEAKTLFSEGEQKDASNDLIQVRKSIQQSHDERSAKADARASDLSSLAEDKQILDSFNQQTQEMPNENA